MQKMIATNQQDAEEMGRKNMSVAEREWKRKEVWGWGIVVMSHHQVIIPQWAGLLWGWQSDTYRM